MIQTQKKEKVTKSRLDKKNVFFILCTSNKINMIHIFTKKNDYIDKIVKLYDLTGSTILFIHFLNLFRFIFGNIFFNHNWSTFYNSFRLESKIIY